MKKIISISICQLLFVLITSNVYSQESINSTKTLYKIVPANTKATAINENEQSRSINCVYSCETNAKTNQAIVTTIDEKGIVKKETYVLKTNKK